MPHIDPERLALFAIGEPVATPTESAHLGDCPVCVDDLAALRHAVVAGRASFDVGELEAPPESVWSRIVEELALETNDPEPAAPIASATPAVVDAPRRRVMTRIWALAASLVLVAGVGLGFVFGPAIGGVLTRFGHSAPMWCAAVLCFMNLVAAFFLLPESRHGTPDKVAISRFDLLKRARRHP